MAVADNEEFRRQVEEAMNRGAYALSPPSGGESLLDKYSKRSVGSKLDTSKENKNWLERGLDALDYAGNVVRTGVANAVDENVTWAQTGDRVVDALDRRWQTSPEQAKDAITKSVFGTKVRFGEDDGKFDVGDVGDFVADVAVSSALDPLSWLSAGTSSLLRGGKAAAVLGDAAHVGAIEHKAGLATEAAKQFGRAKDVAAMGIGASYGVGASDSDDSFLSKLAQGAMGAGAVKAGKAYLPAAGKLIQRGFDGVSDKYIDLTRGVQGESFTKMRDVANESFAKIKDRAAWIRQGRFDALDGLDDAGKLETTQLMQEFKTEFIKRRNEKVGEWKKMLGVDDVGPVDFNRITQEVSDEMDGVVVPAVLANKRAEIGEAAKNWALHNDRVIKKFNQEVFDLSDGKPAADGKGLVGLRWHVDDVYELKDLRESADEADNALMEFGKIYRAESLQRSKAGLEIGIDESYSLYADDFAKKFLNTQERKALDYLRQIEQLPEGSFVEKFEKGLETFDKVTGFMKTNMLMFSSSWMKNNFFDNISKSYIENGLPAVVDTASLGAFQKEISKDIWDLYRGKLNRKYSSDEINDAFKRGVLDNPLFSMMDDPEAYKYFLRPSDISAIKDKSQAWEYVRGLPKMWTDTLASTVGTAGSYVEGSARVQTYLKSLESLQSSPRFAGAKGEELAKLKDIAAKVTKDAFFDYGSVRHLEGAVLKRLIPFYSFYAKNLPYWVESGFDMEKAGRIANVDRLRQNIGNDPTGNDRDGLTPYLQEGVPRKLGFTEKGEKEYAITPSFSFDDAVRSVNPGSLVGQIVEKSNPLLKAPLEIALDSDSFSGVPLRASTQDEGKKYLYSRGFKHKALQDLFGLKDSMQVELDARGNPFTTSDATVIGDKIVSTLMPHGLIDQLAGSTGKVATGRESFLEALANRVLPVQTVKVSAGMERALRAEKLKKDDEAKYGKAQN